MKISKNLDKFLFIFLIALFTERVEVEEMDIATTFNKCLLRPVLVPGHTLGTNDAGKVYPQKLMMWKSTPLVLSVLTQTPWKSSMSRNRQTSLKIP